MCANLQSHQHTYVPLCNESTQALRHEYLCKHTDTCAAHRLHTCVPAAFLRLSVPLPTAAGPPCTASRLVSGVGALISIALVSSTKLKL